jgi:UDP-N-acetylmuramoyl-tripeptide--D-alanyl-D-alanine ligase
MLASLTPARDATGRAGRRIAILGDMLELGPKSWRTAP